MSSKYNGSGKEIAALNTYIKLIRATESINSSINNLLTKEGFTESQFRVMDALYHLGPLSQKSLGEKLLKSGGNITMVIDNLEKAYNGIKERVCDEQGNLRRFVNFYLNDEDIRFLNNLDTEVGDGDGLSIVPAISGG